MSSRPTDILSIMSKYSRISFKYLLHFKHMVLIAYTTDWDFHLLVGHTIPMILHGIRIMRTHMFIAKMLRILIPLILVMYPCSKSLCFPQDIHPQSYQ